MAKGMIELKPLPQEYEGRRKSKGCGLDAVNHKIVKKSMKDMEFFFWKF